MTPIYEDVLPLDLMRKLAGNSSCGDCGGVLTVCWSADKNCYALRCGADWNHNTTKPVDLSAEYAEYASKLGWRNKRLQKEIGTSKELALRQYEYLPRLNKAQATDVVMTLWPGASDLAKTKAVMICVQYGLNPLMKHVHIISFNKRDKEGNIIGTTDEVVLGIQASRQITSTTAGRYSYIGGTPRVMTEQEQKEILGAFDETKLWCITKLKDMYGNVFPGYGFWPKGAYVQGGEKGNTPFNMGCIRSERQALDKMKPGVLPPDVGVMDELYMPKVTVEEKPEGTMGKVNTLTGEVVEETAEVPGDPIGNIARRNAAMQAVVDEADKKSTRSEAPKYIEQVIPNASVASQGGLGTPSEKKQVETVVGDPVGNAARRAMAEEKDAESKIFIDIDWLNESLKRMKYADFGSYVRGVLQFKVVTRGKTVQDILEQLTHEQQEKLVANLRERAEASGVTLD